MSRYLVPLFTFSSLIRSFTFSLGITIRNQIVCTSLEFNEFFGSSFDVPCFVFSSFVVQFSRYRSLPLFATAYLVYHTQFRLSRGFQNFFQVSFRHFRSLQVAFSASFLRSPCLSLPFGHRLPCGALLYYHFLLLLSTPFFTFFQLFRAFFSTFRAFYPFFRGFGGLDRVFNGF